MRESLLKQLVCISLISCGLTDLLTGHLVKSGKNISDKVQGRGEKERKSREIVILKLLTSFSILFNLERSSYMYNC